MRHGAPCGTTLFKAGPGQHGRCTVFMAGVAIMLLGAAVSVRAQEDYSQWPHFCHILLNTGSSGAQVGQDLFGVPVLIRLNAGNFEGMASGTAIMEDVRFASAAGDPLSYEVERWEYGSAGDDSAEIWVRVDTVRGNDTTQYVTMYWGNPSESRSNGAGVFDTASGYIGVWHLDNTLLDATAWGNDGTDFFSNPAVGIIGEGRVFDASRQTELVAVFNNPSLSPVSQLTATCWFRTAQVVPAGSKVSVIRHDKHFNAFEMTGGIDGTSSLLRSTLWLQGTKSPAGFIGTVGILHGSFYVTAGEDDVLKARETHLLLYEMFKKYNNPDGTISLISLKNNRFVIIDQANGSRLRATGSSLQEAERFRVVAPSDSLFTLQASTGQFVTVDAQTMVLAANSGGAGTLLAFSYESFETAVEIWEHPQYTPRTFTGICGVVSGFLGTYMSTMTDQELVMLTATHYLLNEQYTKINNTDGTVSFQSQKTNRYLGIDVNNGNRVNALKESIGPTEQFALESFADGTFALKASNGLYLSPGSASLGLTASAATVGLMERFRLYYPPDAAADMRQWNVADDLWHHLAVTYDLASGYRTYLDGVLIAEKAYLNGRLQASTNALYLGGAGETGGEYFSGVLDEVTWQRVERPAAWVRLSYENQKPEQTLVRIQPMQSTVAPRQVVAAGNQPIVRCRNPLRAGALIELRVQPGAPVSLTLFSLRGARVKTLVSIPSSAKGLQHVMFDGRDDAGRVVAAGSYLLRMRTGMHTVTRSVVIP